MGGVGVILGINRNGKVILARCACSHDRDVDEAKYGEERIILVLGGNGNICLNCGFYPWRIKDLSDKQLRRPEV